MSLFLEFFYELIMMIVTTIWSCVKNMFFAVLSLFTAFRTYWNIIVHYFKQFNIFEMILAILAILLIISVFGILSVSVFPPNIIALFILVINSCPFRIQFTR